MCTFVWKRVALCLACLGILMPQSAVLADSQPVARGVEIELGADGTLTGTVLSAQGRPVANAPVMVQYRGIPVARTRANAHGRFAVAGLRGGVHELLAPGSKTAARLWATGTAPAAAKPAALLVAQNRVVRGQGCGEDFCGDTGCVGCGEDCGTPWGSGSCLLGGFGGLGGSGGLGGLGGGGLVVGGLAVAGIATAVAVAADDDDDPPASP